MYILEQWKVLDKQRYTLSFVNIFGYSGHRKLRLAASSHSFTTLRMASALQTVARESQHIYLLRQGTHVCFSNAVE